jgi:hypothetical protein
VQKFRSVEEMDLALPISPEDSGPERFFRHCARWWALAPRAYPRGVFKFRTIQEAQRARETHRVR